MVNSVWEGAEGRRRHGLPPCTVQRTPLRCQMERGRRGHQEVRVPPLFHNPHSRLVTRSAQGRSMNPRTQLHRL